MCWNSTEGKRKGSSTEDMKACVCTKHKWPSNYIFLAVVLLFFFFFVFDIFFSSYGWIYDRPINNHFRLIVWKWKMYTMVKRNISLFFIFHFFFKSSTYSKIKQTNIILFEYHQKRLVHTIRFLFLCCCCCCLDNIEQKEAISLDTRHNFVVLSYFELTTYRHFRFTFCVEKKSL